MLSRHAWKAWSIRSFQPPPGQLLRRYMHPKPRNRSFTAHLPNSASTEAPAGSSPPSSSISPDEISHFNALASTWWDAHGSSRMLHLMNPLRHDFIRACQASYPSHSRLAKQRYLDIGCGGGIFAESAARLLGTESVTAIDPSPEILTVARRHAAQDPVLTGDRLRYLGTPIECLPPQLYDVVTCFEVVEHVQNPAAFLDRCGEFVRPGGWLVLSTISRTWLSWFTTNLVAEDLLGMVPKGTHDWNKYINHYELAGHFAKRAGWRSPRVMGVIYVPGLGWREVRGGENIGNYFFGIRREEPSHVSLREA